MLIEDRPEKSRGSTSSPTFDDDRRKLKFGGMLYEPRHNEARRGLARKVKEVEVD